MMNLRKPLKLVVIHTLLFISLKLMAADSQQLIDVHLHFNEDQMEVTDVSDAIHTLKENNVVFGIVSSNPPSLALELANASGGWIIPFFMPYLEPERKFNWYYDKRVLPKAREALVSGQYKGLGEMHLIAGFSPSLEKRHVIIDGILDLAEEFDVPAHLHVEASSERFFLPLCQRHPKARIVWVHAGSPLPPEKVSNLLHSCTNVWVDFSARDHMRYGKINPIVDKNGKLLPEWRDFVLKYQDRVLLGSDPVYYEGVARWESANTGWNYVGEVLDFHRHWLSGLPAKVSQKLALENAIRFYRLSESDDLRNH